MDDKELDNYMKTVNPNFDSYIEKGTIEMSNEYYNLLEEKMARLINKNELLKKQLEEYKATNEVLSHELTKDKVLQQDCLTTCCGIPIGDIPKLITQQKEFIKYLEEKEKRFDTIGEPINACVCCGILQKYKSIIGDDK